MARTIDERFLQLVHSLEEPPIVKVGQRTKLNPADRYEMLAEAKQGIAVTTIAKKYKVSNGYVTTLLKDLGFSRREYQRQHKRVRETTSAPKRPPVTRSYIPSLDDIQRAVREENQTAFSMLVEELHNLKQATGSILELVANVAKQLNHPPPSVPTRRPIPNFHAGLRPEATIRLARSIGVPANPRRRTGEIVFGIPPDSATMNARRNDTSRAVVVFLRKKVDQMIGQ